LDADLLDGLDANSFARLDGKSNLYLATANLPVGWYTIAVNEGDRAVARFGIRDIASDRHQNVVFYASHMYGEHSEITVLHSSRFNGTPIRYIRIKEGSTYDGALLQVYVDNSSNNLAVFLLGDNFQDRGWVLTPFVPDGTNPGGVSNFSALTYVAAQVDLDNIMDGGIATTGQIYAGDKTTQYKVWHAGNDGTGSGLDADLVRGLPADFTSSKTTNGYQKLPSGLIIQWGLDGLFTISADSSVDRAVTFPIAFPNVCLLIKVSKYIDYSGAAANVSADVIIGTITTTGFTIAYDNTAFINKTVGGAWLAIGY